MTADPELPLVEAFQPFHAPPPPFQKHSDTSREAAQAIKPDTSELRTKVFECIRAAGPAGRTDDEIQALLGMDGSTERPRRRELQLNGRVRETAEKRKTSTGRFATVWIAP